MTPKQSPTTQTNMANETQGTTNQPTTGTQANVKNAINTGTETQGATNQPANQLKIKGCSYIIGVAGEHAAGVINPATPEGPC